MKTDEHTTPTPRRQLHYACVSSGPIVRSEIGVRPFHRPVASSHWSGRVWGKSHEGTLPDAWGSVRSVRSGSWGPWIMTVTGVSARPCLWGPGCAAPEGGEVRSADRWGPIEPTLFPHVLFLGKRSARAAPD